MRGEVQDTPEVKNECRNLKIEDSSEVDPNLKGSARVLGGLWSLESIPRVDIGGGDIGGRDPRPSLLCRSKAKGVASLSDA